MLLLTNSPNTRSRTPNKEDVGITVVAEVCLVTANCVSFADKKVI